LISAALKTRVLGIYLIGLAFLFFVALLFADIPIGEVLSLFLGDLEY